MRVVFRVIRPGDVGVRFCSRLRSFAVRFNTRVSLDAVDTLSLDVVIQCCALMLCVREVSGADFCRILAVLTGIPWTYSGVPSSCRDNAAN